MSASTKLVYVNNVLKGKLLESSPLHWRKVAAAKKAAGILIGLARNFICFNIEKTHMLVFLFSLRFLTCLQMFFNVFRLEILPGWFGFFVGVLSSKPHPKQPEP